MADSNELPKESRPVFGAATMPDGTIMVIVGVPKTAWDHMQGSKTLNVDLRKAGVPVSFVLFGGEDQKACKKEIEQWNARNDRATLDVTNREEDFTLKAGGQSRSSLLNSTVFKR